IVERPRAAYWQGQAIDIDWNQQNASWEFLWELTRRAKTEEPIDRFTFGESASPDIVTKRKSRLTAVPEFPVELTDSIKVAGRGTQQLVMPRERIRIFDLDGPETLREWLP
ncbi:MAG: hypothetical protein QGF59_25230, partial [Pirellulaceae bacterium]|nr:hypothetical protein [Pirellulaceae bacterium]